MDIHSKQVILSIFEKLNNSGIEYLLIKNIGDELPNKLSIDKDIDILVRACDKNKFKKLISTLGGIEMIHPYGQWSGFETLYGTEFPKMYYLPSRLMLDVADSLCVKCLNVDAWIPLDMQINASIWLDKVWNSCLQCWQIDDRNLICYLIARCIFDKCSFSEKYIHEIEKRKHLLDEEVVQEKISSICFGFTDSLIDLIKQDNYDKCYEKYIKYNNY